MDTLLSISEIFHHITGWIWENSPIINLTIGLGVGILVGFTFADIMVINNHILGSFAVTVHYIVAWELLSIPREKRNERLLDMCFFHDFKLAFATDEQIEHIEKKLEEKNPMLVTKAFTARAGVVGWDDEFRSGIKPINLPDIETDLNNLPKYYQKQYKLFVEKFQERLGIKKLKGESVAQD